MTTKQLAYKIARELFNGIDADLTYNGFIVPCLERWLEKAMKDTERLDFIASQINHAKKTLRAAIDAAMKLQKG